MSCTRTGTSTDSLWTYVEGGFAMNALRKHKRLAAVSAALLLLLGGLALAYWYFRPDPEVTRLKVLGDQLADPSLPENERREKRREFREGMQKLGPEQRKEVFKDRRNPFDERIKRYFTLSRPEQLAQLDEDINRMERWRKERQQNRGAQPANGWNAGNRGGGFRSDEERD